MTNDFSNDASCKALYNLEDGALTVDSKGSNTLTPYNSPVTNTSIFKQGLASLFLNKNDKTGLYCADADLEANFPFKSGDINQQITLCFWLYPITVGWLGNQVLIGKANSTTVTAFHVSFSAAGANSVYLGYNVGSLSGNITSYLTLNSWYHCAFVLDAINKTLHFRICPDGGSPTNVDPDISALGALTLTYPLVVGNYYAKIASGYLDEVVVFNRLLSDDEIDAIKNGGFITAGRRTFPILNSKTVWQSQTGKRLFPLPGMQVI